MFSLASGQLTAPFISHDDFDWLVPDSYEQGFETPWSKARTEGRWLNYPWSFITILLNTKVAVLLHLVLSIIFALAASKIYLGRITFVAALLIYFAPAASNLSLWPVTQSSSIFMMAALSFGLWKIDRFHLKLSLLSVAVIWSLLTYPAYAPLSLILFVIILPNSKSDLLKTICVYLVSYTCGVLIIFSLNWLFHRHFGLSVAGWRQPTPLFPNGDLLFNTRRYLQFWVDFYINWPAIIASSVAIGICFALKIRVWHCVSLILVAIMISGMEATSSIVAGLDMPSRTSLWVWMAIISPILFLLSDKRTIKIAYACTSIALFVGLSAWVGQYSRVYGVFPHVNHLGHTLKLAASSNAGAFDNIIIFGDLTKDNATKWLHSNRHMRIYFYKEFGIDSETCSDDLCERIKEEISASTAHKSFLLIDRSLVFVVNPSQGASY